MTESQRMGMKTKHQLRQEISDLETEKRVLELRIQIKEEELEKVRNWERVHSEVGLIR